MDAETIVDEPRAPGRRGFTGMPRDPERTAQAILDAATAEFAMRGLTGARVDDIAARAGVNKRMLYHYYGNKKALYTAVLESAYAAIRNAELGLNLDRKPPEESIRTLAQFTWQYFLDNPHFLNLLAIENLHQARHIKGSSMVSTIHSGFIDRLKNVLGRGEAAGLFKPGLDPVEVYIMIASLGAFYLSNRYTLSTIFRRDLMADDRVNRWGETMAEAALAYVRI